MDHSNILRVARKIFSKINQIFPGHAVFAGISPKVWIFILKLKKWPSMTYISVKIRSKLKNLKKCHFLALYRYYWMIRIFPGKSGRVTFLPLWMFNFMQKIGNIVWLEVSKFWGLTIANIVRFRLNWTVLNALDSTLVVWNRLEADMHHPKNLTNREDH